MFNPPPGDLNDREPLIHLASPADFLYRSYRIGNAPIFFGRSKSHRWDSPHGDFGVLYLGGDEYCAFMESIGPWRFENAVCARLPTEKHRLGQGWLQAHLAPGGDGHVWRSDAPWAE